MKVLIAIILVILIAIGSIYLIEGPQVFEDLLCSIGMHDLDGGVSTDALCDEDGYVIYTCQRDNCGYTKNKKSDPAFGHSLVNTGTTIAATCTEPEKIVHKCQTLNCGYIEYEPKGVPLGHIERETTTLPTCADDGYITTTCDRSGCEYTEIEKANNKNGLKKTGHGNYIDKLVVDEGKNLCEDGGQMLKVCEKCLESTDSRCKDCDGMYKGATKIEPEYHAATTEWEFIKAPTLKESGKITGFCADCNLENAVITLPAFNEKDYEKQVIKLSDCKNTGNTVFSITINTWSWTFDVVTEKAHRYNDKEIDANKVYTYEEVLELCGYEVKKNDEYKYNPELNEIEDLRLNASIVPTCANTGIGLLDCQSCDSSLVLTISGKHDYIYENNYHPATCLKGGYTEYVCKTDGSHTYKIEHKNEKKLEHTYILNDEKSVVNNDKKATLVFDCTSVCGGTTISVTDCEIKRVPATCKEQGTIYATFKYKNKEYTNEEVATIDKVTVHFLGNKEIDITRTDYEIEMLEKMVADPSAESVVVPGTDVFTCSDYGRAVVYCSCGIASILENVRGYHMYSEEGGTHVEATCTTPEGILKNCTVEGCDAEKIFPREGDDPAFGHKFNEDKFVLTPATVDAEGSLKVSCENKGCGLSKTIVLPRVDAELAAGDKNKKWTEVPDTCQPSTCKLRGHAKFTYDVLIDEGLTSSDEDDVVYTVVLEKVYLALKDHKKDEHETTYTWYEGGKKCTAFYCKHCGDFIVVSK